MTRTILTLMAGAAALVVGPAQAQQQQDRSPEARLERALEGRVAGEPVHCINLRMVRNQQVISRTAILYDTGSVIYVNRPRAGAEELDDFSFQVVRPFNDRLCNIDTINLVDRGSNSFRGTVFLGEFVPYRRVSN